MGNVLFRVIDLETTGQEPPAEVIEIGQTDLWWNPETKASRLEPTETRLFSAPGGIPVGAMAVHHITPAMVEGLPPCAPADFAFTAGSGAPFALVAHNAKFEQQWFKSSLVPPETRWICTYKAGLRAYPEAPGHKNQELRYHFGFTDLDEALAMPPHRAGPDSYVTALVLMKLLETERVNDLVRWTKMHRYFPTCPLRQHKGKSWEDVPHDYLIWIARKPNDLDDDMKAAAEEELERRRTINA